MVKQDFNGEFLPDEADVAVARLREENARWQDRCLAMQTERDEALAKLAAEREHHHHAHGPNCQEAEAELARLREALEEIGAKADHGIPFYAYGDNEAGCDMSTRLSWICGHVGNALAAAKGEK